MKVDVKDEYRDAYSDWQDQLQQLHRVLLDGERPDRPDKLKGLLNREVRAKQRYDEARRKLLGIPSDEEEPALAD
ncbi:MAG: hypothetical protein GEU28_06060 [Dehalococcoidia bacterium]|nr:hypothetical protein [Dehalococcoidia bacterium]